MKKSLKCLSVILVMLITLFSFSINALAQTTEQDSLQVSLTTDKQSYSLNEDIEITVSVTNTNNFTVEDVSIEALLPDNFELKDSKQETSTKAIDLKAGEQANLSVIAIVKGQEEKPTEPSTQPDDTTEPTNLTETTTKPVESTTENNQNTKPSGQTTTAINSDNSNSDKSDENTNSQNNINGTSPYTGADYAFMGVFLVLFLASVATLFYCLIKHFKKTTKIVSSALCAVIAVTSVIGFSTFKAFADEKADNISSITISEQIKVDNKDYTITANVSYKSKELTDSEWNKWQDNLDVISNTIDELTDTVKYKNADDEQKVELMRATLENLQADGRIADLHYNDYTFHYDYAGFGAGGVVLKDTHDDNCFGTSSITRDTSLITKENITKFTNSKSNQNWSFLCGVSSNEDEQSFYYMNELSSIYGSLVNIDLDCSSTISYYKGLAGKDLIYIMSHAIYDEKNTRPVIWTREEATDKKQTDYQNDIDNKSVGVYYNENSKKLYFTILPSFFENNYQNNELNNSIVLLACCEAFGKNNWINYSFYDSLKKAGASTVIGFCNVIDQVYSNSFYEKILQQLVTGYSIGYAFDKAKDIIGNNENEFFENFIGGNKDEMPGFPVLAGEKNKTLLCSDLNNWGEHVLTVQDSISKESLENVNVGVYQLQDGKANILYCYKTDKNGKVIFNLPAGDYTCVLQHKNYNSEEISIEIEVNTTTEILDPVYLTRKNGSVCAGIVKDSATNNPIKDVRVEAIDNSSDSFEPIATTTTDENGNFTLNLPYGEYSLSFHHDNYNYYGMTLDVDSDYVVLQNPILLNPINQIYTTEDGFNYILTDDNTVQILSYEGIATDLVIPETIDSRKVTALGDTRYIEAIIDNFDITSMFVCNENTKSITISKNIKSVDVINGLSLENIIVDDTNPYYSSENGILFSKNKTELIQYPMGKKELKYTVPDTVTKIHNLAFYMVPLEEINVSENNKNYSSENGVLFNKDKTQLITIPYMKNVTSYTVPNTVKEILGASMLNAHIKEFILPENVEQLNTAAFISVIYNSDISEEIKIKVMNKNICLEDYSIANLISTPFVIYGYSNSTAEKYADKYNIKFVSID